MTTPSAADRPNADGVATSVAGSPADTSLPATSEAVPDDGQIRSEPAVEMSRFACLEGLRMWMAWWVVFGHALHLSGTLTSDNRVVHALMQGFRKGHIAVDVFVILSGFVIAHLLCVKSESYPRYITRRFFRLWPLLAAAVVLMLSIQGLYRQAYVDPSWAYKPDMRIERLDQTEARLATHTALKLSMLHGVVPDEVLPYSTSSILSPAWSISLEWQFYLVAPLLVWIARSSWQAAVALFAACAALSYGVAEFRGCSWQVPAVLPLKICLFLVGIGSRLALNHLGKGQLNPWTYAAAAIGVVVAMAAASVMLPWLKFPFGAALFLAFSPILLEENGRFDRPLPLVTGLRRALFDNAWAGSLGRWSYSTYLIHIPLFVLWTGLWAATFGIESSRDHFTALIVSFPVIAAVSYATFRLIEVPGTQVGRTASGWAGRLFERST